MSHEYLVFILDVTCGEDILNMSRHVQHREALTTGVPFVNQFCIDFIFYVPMSFLCLSIDLSVPYPGRNL